jgi:hypothetical protein
LFDGGHRRSAGQLTGPMSSDECTQTLSACSSEDSEGGISILSYLSYRVTEISCCKVVARVFPLWLPVVQLYKEGASAVMPAD